LVISTFLSLLQKVEQKNIGKPKRSACFAGPAHSEQSLWLGIFFIDSVVVVAPIPAFPQ
jgi:hypothetical protein